MKWINNLQILLENRRKAKMLFETLTNNIPEEVIKDAQKQGKKQNRRSWLFRLSGLFITPFATDEVLGCNVNECNIEYYGACNVNPNERGQLKGWHFVIATHRKTGRKYYGFRCVIPISETEVLYVIKGNKLKPDHTYQQVPDDAWKGFTDRFKVYKRID